MAIAEYNITNQEDRSLFEQAVRLRDEGKLSEALALLEMLLPKYPRRISLLALVGRLYWEKGGLDQAINYFKLAIQISPKSEVVSLALFNCLWEMGKRDEALEEAKRFMSLSYSNDYIEIVREINQKAHHD